MKKLQNQNLVTERQIPPPARVAMRCSLPSMMRAAALGLVAVIGAAGLAACSSDSDTPQIRTVVVDSSVTDSAPKEVKLDGLTASFYYSTVNALGVGWAYRPVVHMTLTRTDVGEPKSFRTKVELRQGGNLIDAYFAYDDQGFSKNEKLVDDIAIETSVGLIPQKTGPRYDGKSDDVTSKTGNDFEFTLTDMEVGDTPFTPTEKARRTSPTFTDTPDDQFNKLANDRRWTAAKNFVSSKSSGTAPDPIRAPAIAMRSFIQQVNDKASSAISPSSPTQTFQDWMKGWNPDMLAAGIDMLGDDAIKETYRRVQAGDIEQWFGSGTYVVGTGPNQIPPGTYQATATPDSLIKGGYWERTSISGDIIDNNFISSAQQVTVTIAPSDGQFTSSKMRTWKPVG